MATLVLSTLAIIYSALKAWTYCRRNFNGILNISVIIWFFVYCFGAVANVLLLICTAVCIYHFIVFEKQTVLYILLPSESFETKIQLWTSIAFFCKVRGN